MLMNGKSNCSSHRPQGRGFYFRLEIRPLIPMVAYGFPMTLEKPEKSTKNKLGTKFMTTSQYQIIQKKSFLSDLFEIDQKLENKVMLKN